MKQRPILFSTEMVKAILEGRKTQTRRVIHPQPEQTRAAGKRVLQVSNYCTGFQSGGQAYYWKENGCWNSSLPFKCPYGQTGDVLWVRESCVWVLLDHAHDLLEGARERTQYVYKASMHPDWMEYARKKYGYKWKPSIHMPKDACRLFLRITNVRVERLQQISREDAVAEGIKPIEEGLQFGGVDYPGNWYMNYGREGYSFVTALESFQSLWQSINGEQSWNDNPWVWVIEFERVEEGEL